MKPRCATMRRVNSSAKSTLDCSRAPDAIVDCMVVPGSPIIACPEFPDTANRLLDILNNPEALLNCANTIRASVWLMPFVKLPVMIPCSSTDILSRFPREYPSKSVTTAVDVEE